MRLSVHAVLTDDRIMIFINAAYDSKQCSSRRAIRAGSGPSRLCGLRLREASRRVLCIYATLRVVLSACASNMVPRMSISVKDSILILSAAENAVDLRVVALRIEELVLAAYQINSGAAILGQHYVGSISERRMNETIRSTAMYLLLLRSTCTRHAEIELRHGMHYRTALPVQT